MKRVLIQDITINNYFIKTGKELIGIMALPQEWMNIAKQHRHAGRLEAAEVACRQGLEENRDNTQLLHLLSVILYETRKLPESLQAIDKAISINGGVTSYHNNRAVLLYEMGQIGEAEASLRRAITLDSKNASAYNNLGNAQRFLGKLEEAVASFTQALQIQPNHVDALNNLAISLRELGKLDEAEDAWQKALLLSPQSVDIIYNLGVLQYLRQKVSEAENLFRQAIDNLPTYPPLYRGLVNLLLLEKRWNEALIVLKQANSVLPPSRELSYMNRQVYGENVVKEFLHTTLDDPLFDAYESAIRKAVTPRSTLIEIGDGLGLFSLMAARAGIQQAYIIEGNELLSNLNQQVVGANGLSQRVTVIPEKSINVTVGNQLSEAADVLVYSKFGPGLLQHGTIITLQHAKTHLMKPGARIIPAAAAVYAMLVETPSLAKISPVNNLRGFDYSPFDLTRPTSFMNFDYLQDQYQTLTDATLALDFNFAKFIPLQGKKETALSVINNGLCHGVVFWYDLYLDDQTTFSPANFAQQRYWKQMIQFFDQPIHVTKGDHIPLQACWDENRIYFELLRK